MIIDFHTHAFPPRLADLAVVKLAASVGVTAYSDGTVPALKQSLKEGGITHGVMLNIAVKAGQSNKTNDFAKTFLEEKYTGDEPAIIPFASIHPDEPDWKELLLGIKTAGFKGIKFHPDYQGFAINDPKMEPIYREIAKLGLIVVFHSGYDDSMPDLGNAALEKLADVLPLLEKCTTVLAHLGGYHQEEKVLELIAGKDIYIDTSYNLEITDPELVRKIFKKHGCDRILFASDSPWRRPSDLLGYFRNSFAPGFLSEQDSENVLWNNGAKLLGL